MKNIIIRVLWGDYQDLTNRILRRRTKIDSDIKTIIKAKEFMPLDTFIVLTYGNENTKYLKKLGFQVQEINSSPTEYNPISQCYAHKLFAIKKAFTLYNCDDLVYLDWDCIPQTKVDIEELFKVNSFFQANLMIYKNPKATWRTQDQRKIPNGGYMYIKKEVIDPICSVWEGLEAQHNDEIAYAKFLDNYYGRWIGQEEYQNIHETPHCILKTKRIYQYKETYFRHEFGKPG